MKRLISWCMALVSLSAAASAAVSPAFVEVAIPSSAVTGPTGDPSLANFRSFDLVVNISEGSTDRFNVAGVDIQLSQGTFYSPEFGDDIPADPSDVADHANLRYDTHVTVPGFTYGQTSIAIPGRLHGVGPAQMPRYQQQQTIANIAWGQLGGSGGVGMNRIARFTISNDAVGTLQGVVFSFIDPHSSVSVSQDFTAVIDQGRFAAIPEPTAAAAVVLAAAGLARRRRR